MELDDLSENNDNNNNIILSSSLEPMKNQLEKPMKKETKRRKRKEIEAEDRIRSILENSQNNFEKSSSGRPRRAVKIIIFSHFFLNFSSQFFSSSFLRIVILYFFSILFLFIYFFLFIFFSFFYFFSFFSFFLFLS